MSGRRRLMMVMPEDCLTFDIIAEAGQTFSWTPYSYTGATVDIGYGPQFISSGSTITRTYDTAGLYKFKIYECDCNYAYWRGDANIVRSNERWEYLGARYAQLYKAFAEMPNSECRFRTLPNVSRWSGAFFNSPKATVPITQVPDGVTNLDTFCQMVESFAGNITNFPDSVVTLDGTFSEASGTGKVTLTKLPPNVTTLSIFSFNTQFVYADLSELAANAPEGGYQALTNIYYAFYNNPNITGSQSAFLAVCPNVTNTTNAFYGTSTTE